MQLSDIETMVLKNIGADSYSSLSVDTDAGKIEDFAILHKCIYLAREEIKLNTLIPALLKHATAITTVAGTKIYTISDTDFDICVAVRYRTAAGQEWELIRLNPKNILDKVDNSTGQGTPAYYQIFGNTTDSANIEILPIPATAGDFVDIDYKVILSNLTTSTNEDIIMKKYPFTVYKLASAFAFQLLKKDMANFEKWFLLGIGDYRNIGIREYTADFDPSTQTESFIKQQRKDRFTQ